MTYQSGEDYTTGGCRKENRSSSFKRNRAMVLDNVPVSSESEDLVDRLNLLYLDRVTARLRPTSASKIRRAIGAIAADILVAGAEGCSASRALCRNSFDRSVSYSSFIKVSDFLAEIGLIQIIRGSVFGAKFNCAHATRSKTQFSALPRFWDIARNCGIEKSDVTEHFGTTSSLCVRAGQDFEAINSHDGLRFLGTIVMQ